MKHATTTAAAILLAAASAAAERPWANAEELAKFKGYIGSVYTNDANGCKVRRFWANEEHTEWRDCNLDEHGVRPYALDDPFTFLDGRKVKTASDWRERRAELLELFQTELYGRLPPPPETMVVEKVSEKITADRFSIERRYRLYFRADKSGPVIDWIVFLPRYAKGRVPVFVHLNYNGNDFIATGRTNHYTLPLEQIAARGYAFMSAHYTQISADPTKKEEWDATAYDGVFELWGARDPAKADNPGAIMAWAWGLMRGLDLAERIPEIDASRSVVIGSSRLGKAALVAGAFDERFKVCVPNQTGAVGVQVMKRNFGENARIQEFIFPHWYCKGFWKYRDDPSLQKFDQHLLLACVAPRALLLECFMSDWYDPKGEFASASAASPVWKMLTGVGLGCDAMPEPFDASFARPPFGYVVRRDSHGLSGHDWMWALDFADRALASGASVDTERTYLSGRGCDDAVAWSFEIDKGPRAGVKTTIPVPSCWEMQGFGELQYGQYVRGLGKKWENVDPFAGTAVYRLSFAAPASSAGRHTDLCFEAVFTDCDVELNGVRLGSHQGGYYPFSFDVTGVLKATNELVVVVRDESSDRSVNFAERRGDYWNFGGIWRPVYLETKPLLHIRRVEVDAKADGTLDAVLHVSDGTTRTVHEKWERPRLWTAETPNLYEKAFELRDVDGRVVHRVVKKIGFRTIEARRGDCLRINGSRVTIKGINRHSFRPDTGRTLSYARNREDVMLIKSMNMNAVRCSHYPPDPEFLDLCDELGLYVDDELCGWQRAVGTKPGAPLVEAFVTRDQCHPSVIWWSNGNEGGFNFELDRLYRDFDLQKRPLLHPWDEFEAFHTKHYRNYEQTKAFLEGDWIYMPTEFQHGLHDGGHGAGLGELWALMMSSPRTAGGFLWDMRDQGVLRPDGTYDCYGVNGPDGILGPNGEKGGSVDAVREIWSPIVAKMVSCGADGAAVEFENRYDFTDLSKCGFRWEALGFSGGGEAVLSGGRIDGVSAAPREKARAELPAAAAAGDALRVCMTGPGGEDVFTKVFATGSSRGVRSRGNGAVPRVSAPRLVAFKGTESRCQRFVPVEADFSWSAATNADGSVEFAWTLSTTNAVDLLGVTFDVDESQVASKRWLGKGPYRVWRNRPEGPQLGVWENAYNDGFAGKSWEFPQFKGYFADTRWLELKMKDGGVMRFDMVEPSRYVGVFAPKDNEGNFLFQSPELGISVLEVCPATGDKFTAAKDVSPLGKSVVVPRVVSGRVSVAMMPTAAAEPAFGFRSRIADLHPNRRATDAAPVGADEVVVDARWSVTALSDDPTLRHAAADLSDFFAKSMGVKVVGGGKGRVEIGVDPSLPAMQSKIEVGRGLIRVTGATPREAYQGCCRLEDELSRRGRPAAKAGVRTFTRMFSPRMTHSGWEVEKFPDVYLDQLVHSGMDAILVFIEDPPDVTRNGKVDMNALVERARLRGIDVYAYASFPVKASKFHPLDPGAEEWYDSTYGAIVKNAPGLKGIVCVGESVAFQARDGKTAGFWWGRPEDRVPGKRNNGWWPTMDWVPWLELVSKTTRRYNPDFEVVFWTYNWHSAPSEDRLALLEAIPTNVTVHVTFEMGDKPHYVDGVKKWISDYSIVGVGPSPTFRSEAEVCRRRGIRLTSMSNTGGRTWDSGVAPCEPCPYRWIDRFRALRGAQAEYGLCGLMECHHYGFMPNFISEIAKVAFTAETDASSLDRILAENAARDFGAANAEAVIETWRDWSEAFSYHSAYGQDQYGPLRLGPSYPLFMPDEDVPPPPNPHYSYYEGLRIGNGWRYLCSRYGVDKDLIVANRPHIDREIALWRRGNARLEALMPSVPAGKAAAARRMLGLGQFFERTAETVRNVREFKIAKSAEERLAIVDREEANARATIPLVEYDSSLGWEPTMGYVCDRAMLEWKIGKLDEMRRRLRR